MKKAKVLLLCCVLAAGVCMLAACGSGSDGTTDMQDTNSVEDDVTDDTQSSGSVGKDLEDAGTAVEDGIEDAGNAIEDAGDAVIDGAEDAVDAVDPDATDETVSSGTGE